MKDDEIRAVLSSLTRTQARLQSLNTAISDLHKDVLALHEGTTYSKTPYSKVYECRNCDPETPCRLDVGKYATLEPFDCPYGAYSVWRQEAQE